MYVAQFNDGEGRVWAQGMVRLAPPARGLSARALDEVSGILRRQAATVSDLRDVHLALRCVVARDGRVERVVLIMAPADRENLMRRAIGGFLALERVVDDACEAPLHRDAYDAMLAAFPDLRSPIVLPRQSASNGAWITRGFRVAPFLGELVEQAVGLGLAFGYQAQISPFRATAPLARAARFNLLDLRDARGAPAPLIEEHERLCDAMDRATRLVGETLAVEDEESARWLRDAIDRRFGRDRAGLGIDGPELPFSSDLDLSVAIHDALGGADADPMLPVDEICRQAADDHIIATLLDWRPPAGPAAAPGAPPAPPEDVRPRGGLPDDTPEPYDGAGAFAFISYNHDDAPRILPTLRTLGIPFWYDRGIHGGTEWDSVLEDRIRGCRAVVAFISPAAVESKYCRREIKFADAIDVPILAVMLEPTELHHGLAMLFQQYQSLFVNAPEFQGQLKRALATMI